MARIRWVCGGHAIRQSSAARHREHAIRRHTTPCCRENAFWRYTARCCRKNAIGKCTALRFIWRQRTSSVTGSRWADVPGTICQAQNTRYVAKDVLFTCCQSCPYRNWGSGRRSSWNAEAPIECICLFNRGERHSSSIFNTSIYNTTSWI
jgi:hypothetical protein